MKKIKIEAWKTANRRKKISHPAYLAYELSSQILPDHEYCSILDYGCGYGDDARFLEDLLPKACIDRYDSYFDYGPCPSGKYDVVLLTFVMCTIPSVLERKRVFGRVFRKLKKGGFLVVTVRTEADVRKSIKQPIPYKDGVLTCKNTFQKGYSSHEQLILELDPQRRLEWQEQKLSSSSITIIGYKL